MITNRFYLFTVFGSFCTLLVLIFCLFSFSYNKKRLINSINNEMDLVSSSTCSSITTNLNQLSTISMNVIYSNGIKTNFSEFKKSFSNIDNQNESFISTRERALAISDYIFAMIGPVQSASRVNIYSFDNAVINLGFSTTFKEIDLKSYDWYQQTIALDGKKFITRPQVVSEIPNYSISEIEEKYISLIRVFFDRYHIKEGILEIVQNCNKIFATPLEIIKNSDDVKIFVFNDRAELVFPYSDAIFEENSYEDDVTNQSLFQILNNSNYMINAAEIEDYEWKVIVCIPKNIINSQMTDIKNNFLLLLVLMLFFTLIICFLISNTLTSPVNKLIKITNETNLENILKSDFKTPERPKVKIKEISDLWEAYTLMIKELKETSTEVIVLQSEENKAKILMSQSFVQPHFLYNCLSNIIVMAEENMNDKISKMCSSLTNYLRYISVTSETILETIEKEALNTQYYLDVMQMRYPEEFSYEIKYADSLKDIKIPKLILQSITENVFKHAFIRKPPWHLLIQFYTTDNIWQVSIKDNGGLFSNKDKKEILQNLKNLDVNEELKHLHIGHFGLKNTYIRLKMRYKEKAIFEIDNSREHFTTIIIGGTIKDE